MSTATKLNLVPVEEYLAGELVSPIKHEYLGGVLYARAGARNVHNVIAVNINGALYVRLRGRPCRPFNSDTKIRVRLLTYVRFYYPDASVSCRPNPQTDSFQDEPAVIFEVLSRRTRNPHFSGKGADRLILLQPLEGRIHHVVPCCTNSTARCQKSFPSAICAGSLVAVRTTSCFPTRADSSARLLST